MADLRAESLSFGYDSTGALVLDGVDLVVPPGRITAVVGANACGKSTLLSVLARLLRPASGTVLLDGGDIHRMRTREVALSLGMLPQTPVAPEGITVVDLVSRGRYPHQGWLRQWNSEHEAAVASAMEATEVLDLADRTVDSLSGGQRQRVWIALAIAQETQVLLLDEPTTFLDLAHQIEVLDILVDLNRAGRTIVLVLHDLNHAARYADHVVAMRAGRIVATGAPHEVITESLVHDLMGLRCRVVQDPVSRTPLVLPIGRHHTAGAHEGLEVHLSQPDRSSS